MRAFALLLELLQPGHQLAAKAGLTFGSNGCSTAQWIHALVDERRHPRRSPRPVEAFEGQQLRVSAPQDVDQTVAGEPLRQGLCHGADLGQVEAGDGGGERGPNRGRRLRDPGVVRR